MLVLPTAVGGVLYSPQHFHKIVFDPMFLNITDTAFSPACCQ
jgi:hypothetical protein